MNRIVAAVIVIAVGLLGAYALYEMQYGRLTTARMEQIKETTAKLDDTEAAVEGTAADEPVDMAKADTEAELASDAAES